MVYTTAHLGRFGEGGKISGTPAREASLLYAVLLLYRLCIGAYGVTPCTTQYLSKLNPALRNTG